MFLFQVLDSFLVELFNVFLSLDYFFLLMMVRLSFWLVPYNLCFHMNKQFPPSY